MPMNFGPLLHRKGLLCWACFYEAKILTYLSDGMILGDIHPAAMEGLGHQQLEGDPKCFKNDNSGNLSHGHMAVL